MPTALEREQKYLTIRTQSNATASWRTESFMGRDFMVVPAVFVRSQILRNNLGACWLPPDEITSDWATGWNGIPVLVGEHPSVRGMPTSGRSANLWDERCVGWMFNVRADSRDGVTRLAGEVWIDCTRAEQVMGGAEVMTFVRTGRPVELSTGFQTSAVEHHGVLGNGASYNIVLHPGDPDHLVISTEMTGACSVQDGCGLGVNKFNGEPPMLESTPAGGGGERTPSLWERLKERLGARNANADAANQAKLAIDEAMPVSDMERMNRIRTALQEYYQSRGEVCVNDVYTNENTVIWWLMTPLGPEPPGSEYFRSPFTESGEGGFEFGEPERVRRVTGYEPTAANAGVDTPADNADCGCHSSHAQSLHQEEGDMNQQDLEKALGDLTTNVSTLVTTVNTLAGDVQSLKQGSEQGGAAAINGLKATIGQLVEKVQNMETVTASAVQEKDRERTELISALAGNFRVPFSEEELATKSLGELRKLSEMASNDFTGRTGGARNTSGGRTEHAFAETTHYFDDKQRERVAGSKGGK